MFDIERISITLAVYRIPQPVSEKTSGEYSTSYQFNYVHVWIFVGFTHIPYDSLTDIRGNLRIHPMNYTMASVPGKQHLRWGNKLHECNGNSLPKGQWRGALTFSLIYAYTNGCANNRDAGGLIHHRAHCDVTVMEKSRWTIHTFWIDTIYNITHW